LFFCFCAGYGGGDWIIIGTLLRFFLRGGAPSRALGFAGCEFALYPFLSRFKAIPRAV
jgi:hypothetical protein